MIKDKRRFGKRQNVAMKGALQVIMGAIAGLGIFLVIAVLVGDPEASYADRLSNTTCGLVDDCQQSVTTE